jgi:site-specific DNA-adenine methylase
LDLAISTYVIITQSFNAIGKNYRALEKNYSQDEMSYLYKKKNLRLLPVIERMKGVVTKNMDAIELLGQVTDNKNAVVYLDPPYVAETRICKDVYSYECNNQYQVNLIHSIRDAKCKIVLSGYDNELYDKELGEGWEKIIIAGNTYKYSSPSPIKPKAQEIVWINYKLDNYARAMIFQNNRKAC